MTIHVIVRDPAGTLGEVEIVKPKRSRAVRTEPDLIELELPAKSRRLVLQRSAAAGPDTPPITLDLEAGRDHQEFDLPGTATDDDVDTDASYQGAGDEDVKTTDTDRDADRDADRDRESGDVEVEVEVEPEEEIDEEDLEGEGGLHELAQHVNQQLVRIWRALDDLDYRVTALEAGFADHLADHQPFPLPDVPRGEEPGGEPVEEPQPTGIEAAAHLAITLTTRVRDAFLDAAETFAERLRLVPGADGRTAAGRTLEELTLAANTANSAIAVYETERGRSPRNARLALVAFVGKVQTAGRFYADTVDHLAVSSARTPDPDEQSAYTEALTTLRGGHAAPAIDQLRSFDVGEFDVGQATGLQAGARRTERRGVGS